MVPVTELEMAVSTTYASLLNEIQLSNLNYSIQMTPFAAYITLKKSAQKDLNGEYASPSPPILFLLQNAQQEILRLQEENDKIKAAANVLGTKYENIVHENRCLQDTLEENKRYIKGLNSTNEI